MITAKCIEDAAYRAITRGSTNISPDVRAAFRAAIEKESDAGAKEGLEKTLQSIELAETAVLPACADTGWPIFFIKAGNEAQIEGGFMALEEAVKNAVRRATKEGIIRKTMKDPLSGYDPGDNIGPNIPDFAYKFVPGDAVEITYCAKGGGSECFGGTRQKVVAFADGTQGIEKFVIDAFADAARAGAICPPSVIGVGIGGTANVAANLAKEAAALRLVGSHHSDERIRTMEERLLKGINGLGFGILGAGGDTSALAVNVEFAYTHIAGIVVAISCNCMVARRGTVRIAGDNTVTDREGAYWFGDR